MLQMDSVSTFLFCQGEYSNTLEFWRYYWEILCSNTSSSLSTKWSCALNLLRVSFVSNGIYILWRMFIVFLEIFWLFHYSVEQYQIFVLFWFYIPTLIELCCTSAQISQCNVLCLYFSTDSEVSQSCLAWGFFLCYVLILLVLYFLWIYRGREIKIEEIGNILL